VKAAYNGDDDEEYLPLPLEEEAKRSYLPVTHPLSRPSTTIGAGSYTSTSVYQSTNPPVPIPVVITRIRPQTAKAYTAYKQHERRHAEQQQHEDETEYQGIFRGGYLTPYEKERREYLGLKSKFLDGDFKVHSGKASEMSLRSNGGVQAHGPYPAPILSEKEITKTGHYGPWKPTTDLYPNQRDRTFETISRNTSRSKMKSRWRDDTTQHSSFFPQPHPHPTLSDSQP
jgi:hypothetical protein